MYFNENFGYRLWLKVCTVLSLIIIIMCMSWNL